MSSSGAVRATYRVQLHAGFTLDDAAALVPYLARLGVTHVYCSPYLRAERGSTHGYDVVDHSEISEELGGREALERFCKALAAHDMAHVLDVVPNHMAVAGRDNPAWWDVLKHGPNGRFWRFFDIDWDPPEARLKGKILLPVLGDRYGAVLESGELVLRDEGDERVVTYHDHAFPLAPGTLEQLLGEDPDLDRVNGEPALLHALLERQYYRLAYWRTDLELNYRRFFDINELVALRVEEPEVFAHVHALPLALISEGKLDGLRVDHVDGLRTPGRYLNDLRQRVGDVLLVVEKITERDERLPESWPVDGTTGYDFLNLVLNVLVDPSAEEAFTRIYEDVVGESGDLEEQVLEAKHQVMRELLASDVERLTQRLLGVSERYPRHRDYTRIELREAVREIMASFDVYRSYIDPDEEPRPTDVERIMSAVHRAAARRDDLDPALFEFVAGVLTLEQRGDAEADFLLRFQQTTGPVMAKAVEDTMFYRYVRFVALNEVGGDPGRFGISVDHFHARMRSWAPRSLLATSTHDTKRSEDVRARLALLSEIPAEWADTVARWRKANDRHRTGSFPDPAAEYLLYQTLVGAHPLPVERALAYMEKATKEAKSFTSWTDRDEAYDDALRSFIERVLADDEFVADLDAFVRPLVGPGRVNALAQTLLKLTCPGIPDLYQGNEAWDLSLVDPDNRRAVDYEARRALLDAAEGATAEEVMARPDSGLPKVMVVARALAIRRAEADAFTSGPYEPLLPSGPGAEHLVAFRRAGRVATVVPRLVLRRPPDWGETQLSLGEGEWVNVFTGETVPDETTAGALLVRFPVALLRRA